MTHYPLPHVSNRLHADNIKLCFGNAQNSNLVSRSLSRYIGVVKGKIADHPDEWDLVKKMTNPYEYIHTTLPNSKHAVSKIRPLSRAFFKMIELGNMFDIFPVSDGTPIKSFHLAEGPGGFIEALTYIRFNNQDQYYGMTLIDETNSNVPGWRKANAFLKKNPNVTIETGADRRGDLYNPANLTHCWENYRNSMHLITGDGGFDFSIDFNRQETLALRLILAQVAYAVAMQARGGTFILKMFDICLAASVDILYMLSGLYQEVHVVKPHTSRYANSERYIVCLGFRYRDSSDLVKRYISTLNLLNNMQVQGTHISRILSSSPNARYRSALEEINAILGQQQIETIQSTLRFIENKERKSEKLQQLRAKNIQKCVSWCTKNKIPCHHTVPSGNIFMSSLPGRSNTNLKIK